MPNKKPIDIVPGMGKILISEPFLLDSCFKHSVVLLGEHSEEGSVGFMLNKPTDLKLNDALEDFPPFDAPLYFGGPVQTDTIHFLHTLGEDALEGSKKIMPGIWWGGNLEQLKIMIETHQIKPEKEPENDKIRFFAGYSGWESEHLKDELRRKVWIVSDGTRGHAFSIKPEDLWGNILREMGNGYAVLANFPEDPSLN